MEHKHIVVIDDTVTTLDVVTDILEDEKYKVTPLSKLPSVESLCEMKPDLILLDIFLNGGISGKDFCLSLRSFPQFIRLPIILFSVYSLEKSEIEKFGATAYIRKPFDMFLFLETIEECLKPIHALGQ